VGRSLRMYKKHRRLSNAESSAGEIARLCGVCLGWFYGCDVCGVTIVDYRLTIVETG